MNINQVDRFRQLLVEAMDEYVDVQGGQIISGNFQSVKGQCPLTCLFGKSGGSPMDKWAMECQELIGVRLSEQELWSFVFAFDGSIHSNLKPLYPAAWLLGQELRAQYIKE